MNYYFERSIININNGNTTQALKEISKGYKLAQSSKDENLINTAYYYYAILYKEIGEYEKAEIYHLKNIDYSLNNNLQGELISADYNAYGDLLLKMNRKEDAYNSFLQAENYAKKGNSVLHLSAAYSSQAEYFFEIKNYNKAAELGYQSCQVLERLKLEKFKPYKDQVIGFVSAVIGKSEFELNNKEVAKKYLTTSFNFMVKNNIYDKASVLSGYLKGYYLEKEHYKEAFEAQMNEAEFLEKSLIKKLNDQKKTISRLKLIEDNLLELELAQKEIIKQKQAKKNLYTVIGFISVLSISFIVVSIVLQRKNTFLKILKLEAQESSRKKSEFIDMITHELRTPLYTILGTTQFLFEDNKNYKNTYINALREASTNLLSLINNVLSFSKINKNVLKIENENINLKDLLETIKSNYDLVISKKGNSFTISVDKDLPEGLIGDKFKISEILNNLISNANKFTDNGSILLNVNLDNKTHSECYIKFSINDTGIGISESRKKTIFNAFQEESTKIKKEYEGIGLGLSIVQKYISFLGSKLELQSELNKGTSISFILKFKYDEQIKHQKKETISSSKNGNLNRVEILRNKRVLVVEDNKFNQLLTVKILKRANIETITADNGLKAIEQFKSHPQQFFDLILMDIHMPVMDGYEATLKIRTLDKSIPIIALTAVNIDKTPENLKTLGLNYSINKPFDQNMLFNYMVQFILQNKNTHEV